MAAVRKLALQCVGSSGDLHVTYLDVCFCALHSCVQRVQGGNILECLLLLGKVLTVPAWCRLKVFCDFGFCHSERGLVVTFPQDFDSSSLSSLPPCSSCLLVAGAPWPMSVL